jgi:hypothetical protein
MNDPAIRYAQLRSGQAGSSRTRISHILGMGMGMGPRDEGADVYHSQTHLVYGEAVVDRHEWRHTVFLVEFLMKTGWQSKIEVPSPPAEGSSQALHELEELKVKQAHEDRRERAHEIIAEIYDYIGLYENLCFFDAHSHPVTSGLIRTVDLIGWTVLQYYKELCGRRRPSQVDPAIRPLIRVPPFSSYPSGHAMQPHLIKCALQEVLGAGGDSHSSNTSAARLGEELENITERIAVNREWAGVHYRSDTEAGKKLALDVWALIARNNNFIELIKQAKLEWQPSRAVQSGQQFLDHGSSAATT